MIPNKINLKKLEKLLIYCNRYEITIQFWPQQTAVFICKDGVDLTDFGGDFNFAITKATEYLNRITGNKEKVKVEKDDEWPSEDPMDQPYCNEY